jgi:hypothetical protein
LGESLLDLKAITVNPSLIISDNPGWEGCIIRGNLPKLPPDVDTTSDQPSELQAQIWQEHNACPIQQPKSIVISHNQFQYHQQGLEWFSIDPHE